MHVEYRPQVARETVSSFSKNTFCGFPDKNAIARSLLNLNRERLMKNITFLTFSFPSLPQSSITELSYDIAFLYFLHTEHSEHSEQWCIFQLSKFLHVLWYFSGLWILVLYTVGKYFCSLLIYCTTMPPQQEQHKEAEVTKVSSDVTHFASERLVLTDLVCERLLLVTQHLQLDFKRRDESLLRK